MNAMKTLVAAISMTVAGLAMAQAPAVVTTPAAPATPAVVTAPAAAPAAATPHLDKREVKQQQRIDQGVASGQLTAAETNRMDKREAKLANNEAAAKADGKVTRAERRQLQHQANRDSRAIHRAKHNAHTAN